MEIERMSIEELQAAHSQLLELAQETAAADRPQAARVLHDVAGMVIVEIENRAFGGGPEARAYAARLHRERHSN